MAKSNIVLSLRPKSAAMVSQIIDNGKKTTKDLWEELDKAFATLSTQQIMNLIQKLEGYRAGEHNGLAEEAAVSLEADVQVEEGDSIANHMVVGIIREVQVDLRQMKTK